MLFFGRIYVDRLAGTKQPASGSGEKRQCTGKLDHEKARPLDSVSGSHKSTDLVAHRLVKNPQPLDRRSNRSRNTEKVSLPWHDGNNHSTSLPVP
jgi:hypothetical protein